MLRWKLKGQQAVIGLLEVLEVCSRDVDGGGDNGEGSERATEIEVR